MFARRSSLISGIALCAVLGTQAISQTVTIQSVDGNISLRGTIVDFDGKNYDFESGIGRRLIPVAAVVCIGEACPDINDSSTLNADLAVTDRPSKALLDKLVQAFASRNGLTVSSDSAGKVVLADSQSAQEGILSVNDANQRDAFSSLVEGKTNVVFSTAPISNDLAEELVADGFPDLREAGREVVVALDAIVPSVYPSNAVRDLSLPDVAQIAAGRITNWSELGGPDLKIRMVLPEDDTSIAKLLDERVMRPNRLRINRSMERVATEADAAAIVANDPAAITLTSAALAGENKPLPIRQVCGPLSVATDFAIKAEEYPLARRVLMYTSGEQLSEGLKGLLSYAGSSEAQAQFVDSGFYGQTVENVPMSLQGTRLASAILQTENPAIFEQTRELTQTLAMAERLSTTFRFEPGSTELDNKSRRDAVRIADYILQPENTGREILLFGFTDSVGRGDLNKLLSLQQAVKIKEAIVTASSGEIDADRINVTSHGSISPVACNDTAEGRNSNRRVEVWLR